MTNTSNINTENITLKKCASDGFLAWYNNREDIIANGETAQEAFDNLCVLYDSVIKYEKEAEEPKRIEVKGMALSHEQSKGMNCNVYVFHQFPKTIEIPKEKYEAVKKAIERELNGETWLQQQEYLKAEKLYQFTLPENKTSDTIQDKQSPTVTEEVKEYLERLLNGEHPDKTYLRHLIHKLSK